MSTSLSTPPRDAHIAACGLFCTNCKSFQKGKCQGCQIKPPFSSCPTRNCCQTKSLVNCAGCNEFATPRDYRECKKVYSLLSRTISFFTGSNRPAALAMLRDQGTEAYLAEKRKSGKM